MISYVLLVLSFAFVNCKSFHANQHIPVQRYQPPLQYSSPLPAYPQQYIPIFNPTLNRQGDPSAPLTSSEVEELQRQYQQWQISLPNQQQGGTVWISAPQYSYYPPPPNYPHYPDQSQVPYPPSPPGAHPLPPQSGQPPQSSQPPQQPINPSLAWSRETSGTTPSNGSSTITNPPTSEPSNPSPTQPAEQSTVTIESTSTFAPTTESSTTEFSSSSTSEISTSPGSTSSESTTPSFTTDLPTSSTPSNSTEVPSNATSSTTPKPSNATSNATSNNPLLKYCTQSRGQFKSEDCGKFVNCWDDVAVEQDCPAGLYFNDEKHYCDYPQNVDCGNRTTSGSGNNNSTNTTEPSGSNNSTSGPGGSSNSTTNSKCPVGYGTYRNTSNCAAFYVCVDGEPVDFACPPGTNYNDDLKVCDYPYRVDCKGAPSIPIPEESSTSNVTETPPPTESSNSSSSTTPASSSSSSSLASSSTSSSSSTTASSTSTTTESSISTTSSESSTTELSSSTLPPAPVTTTSGELPQGPPPPPVDPIGYYNFNLKKLPESIVNTGVRCYHANVYRLTPDCSSVTVCQDGLNYIVNCASGTSFDAYSQRCVPTFRARC